MYSGDAAAQPSDVENSSDLATNGDAEGRSLEGGDVVAMLYEVFAVLYRYLQLLLEDTPSIYQNVLSGMYLIFL